MALFHTVPQSHCVIIERFGRFSRIQRQGMRFCMPMLEQVRHVESWGTTANKKGFIIELTEQQTDTPPRQCHTKDNVPVSVNATVYWRIVDPKKAVYEVDVLPRSISETALSELRSSIGMLDLDSVLSEREKLNERIVGKLKQYGDNYGVDFIRVEIQELETDAEVAQSMLKQMDAERQRRAQVASAEGESEALVKVAEAEKKATILRAEGQAIAKAKIAEADAFYVKRMKEELSEAEATRVVMAQKWLSGFETISKNDSNKVFLPSSFQGMFALDAKPARGQEDSA